MQEEITIRPEAGGDAAAISEITRAAFEAQEHSSQVEAIIIEALRKEGALLVSFVAESAGEVVGHIAFSAVKISDGSTGWYGLGPMAVKPEMQGKGIGRALVENGLSALRGLNAQGCVLVGGPAFYQRFGFVNHPQLVFEGIPQEYFLALRLGEDWPSGEVSYHEAFYQAG